MRKQNRQSAFGAFDRAISALQHEGILIRGGLSAYVIYVIAVLAALFFVLQIFVDVAELTTRLLTLVLALLAGGVVAGLWVEYLKFKKEEATARLRGDNLRLKLQLATERGKSIIEFFRFWAQSNPAGFATIMGQDFKLLVALLHDLDDVYADLGIDEARFDHLLASVSELRDGMPGSHSK